MSVERLPLDTVGGLQDAFAQNDLQNAAAVFELRVKAVEIRDGIDTEAVTELVKCQMADPRLAAFTGPAATFLYLSNKSREHQAANYDKKANFLNRMRGHKES